jgi:hypothetical protein
MMEAVQSSETLVDSYQSTQCYNLEDSHFHRIMYYKFLQKCKLFCNSVYLTNLQLTLKDTLLEDEFIINQFIWGVLTGLL